VVKSEIFKTIITKKMDFEKAYKRLKEINETLQSGQIIDIDQILKLQKEAKENYNICKEIILKTENKSA